MALPIPPFLYKVNVLVSFSGPFGVDSAFKAGATLKAAVDSGKL